MSDLPDSALVRLFFEYVAPAIGTAAGVISGVIAWGWNGLTKRVEDTVMRISALEVKLPETYANRSETHEAFREVGERIDKVGDKVDMRLQTIETDVKGLLKIVIEQHSRK